MRTTIELKEEHRARLLELAARRGEKGFSGVIGEAIEAYLAGDKKAARLRKKALKLRGTLSAPEASRLRRETTELRKTWR